VKLIKVNDELYEKIKTLAEKRQMSMADIVEEAINILLGSPTGEKAIKKYVDKYITLQYDSKCSKCGKELRKGDKARYVLYVYEDDTKKYFFLCPDCDIESNPTLWRLYVKRKELETVIKQLNSEIKKKIDILNNLEYQIKVSEIKRNISIN
jgi:Ribbon-helix-helix protein, copG family.